MSLITIELNFAIFLLVSTFICGLTIPLIINGIISIYKDCKKDNRILPLYRVNVINPINTIEDNK